MNTIQTHQKTEITLHSPQLDLKLYRLESLSANAKENAVRSMTSYYQANYSQSLSEILDEDDEYLSNMLADRYGLSFDKNNLNIDFDYRWISIDFQVSEDFYEKIIDEELSEDETKKEYLKDGIQFFKDCYDDFTNVVCKISRGSISKVETAYNDLMSDYAYDLISDYVSCLLENKSDLNDDDISQKRNDMINQINSLRYSVISKLEEAANFIYTSLDDSNDYQQSNQAVLDWLENSYRTFLFNEEGMPLAVINIEIDKENGVHREVETISMISIFQSSVRTHPIKFKFDEKNI